MKLLGWASGGMVAVSLAGCVSAPRAVVPIETASLSYAMAVIDESVAGDLSTAEREDLLRVLNQLGHGGAGKVRAFPTYSFRPANMAVVAKEGGVANHPAKRKRSVFARSGYEARFNLALIDDGGKKIYNFAVAQSVGKNDREIARRACFQRLMAELVQAPLR